jgi:hypothetical protein
MKFIKEKTVFFSGDKHNGLPFLQIDTKSEEYNNLRRKIRIAINRAISNGYDTFFCNMENGFDLICAIPLVHKKMRKKNVRIIAVRPQKSSLTDEWNERREFIMRNIDQEIIIPPNGNKFMIENSSCLICYPCGQDCNTTEIIRIAETCGISVYNISSTPKSHP